MSKRRTAVFLCALLSVFYGFYFYGEAKASLPDFNFWTEKYGNQEIQLTGIVESVKKSDYGIRLIVKNCTIGSLDESTASKRAQSRGLKTVVSVSQRLAATDTDSAAWDVSDFAAGETVQIDGTVKEVAAPRNEGEFDMQTYYRSIGIRCQVAAKQVERIQEADTLQRLINRLRHTVETVYNMAADTDDAGLLQAIVLGDRTNLNEETYQLYQRNGIAHLLAISGLHISFIGLLVYRGLKKLLPGYVLPFCAGMFLMSFYGVMTGGGISVKRAVLMCVACMGADVLGRAYDLLSAVCLSALILMLENIYVLYHSGFQLSFAAMLGIAVLYPAAEKLFLPRAQRAAEQSDIRSEAVKRCGLQLLVLLLKSFLSSLCISVMLLPVIAYHYFQIPVYSIVLNMIVIPPMSVFLLCALLTAALGMFSLWAASFLTGTTHYILRFYTQLCGVFDGLPGSIVVTGRPQLWQCVLFYALLFLFVGWVHLQEKMMQAEKYPGKKSRSRGFAGCGLLLVAAAVLLVMPRRVQGVVIDMIDVGQGDCILVRDGQGTYLFDGGSSNVSSVGSRRIAPMLQANAVTKLNYVFVSHCDTDHISGILELLTMQNRLLTIDNLVLPEPALRNKEENCKKLLEAAKRANVNVLCAGAGARFGNKQGADFYCLHPDSSYLARSTNDASAVYRMQYGEFTMLFTGDLEAEGEKELLKNDCCGKITVLKAAHHGSAGASGEAFLASVRPQFALISCGIRNAYGHPAKETLERLNAQAAGICITARDGQITIRSDGSRFTVDTMLKAEAGA